MKLPQHVAIIMDGNGRWAEKRLLPRIAGHKQGLESVRAVVQAASQKGIQILTLFAFSSENWIRPQTEVDFLLSLILRSLKNELTTLNKNNVRLKVIGDRARFNQELNQAILDAELLTENNTGLCLNIALNYGGRWDIVQAARLISLQVKAGNLDPSQIDENLFESMLSLSPHNNPDFLIRTSGEQRISNFLLWDSAYTELYFTETLWPDFKEEEFYKALEVYNTRQRRFGQASLSSISSIGNDNEKQIHTIEKKADNVDT